MGFTNGIYKVKKFNNLTLPQIYTIQDYYVYNESAWAKQYYKTWQEYSKSLGHNPDSVTEEDINAYKDEYIEREYTKSVSIPCGDWCSCGAHFHQWFTENAEKVESLESTYIITKPILLNAIKYCREELNNMKFKQAFLTRSFTVRGDNEEIVSSLCAGIEVEDEDGNIRRVYTDEPIYMPEAHFDPDKYFAFDSLQDTLFNILCSTDFDKEIVEYNGGW